MKYTAQVLSCVLLSFSRLGWLFIRYKRCMVYGEGRRSASSSSSRLLLPQPGQQMYNFFSPPPRCWDYYYCVPAWQRQRKRPFVFRSLCVICEYDVDVVVVLRARRWKENSATDPPTLCGSFAPPQIIFPTSDKPTPAIYIWTARADTQMIRSLTFCSALCYI